MTDTKHEFGWYMADGGSYGGNGSDPWQLIEEAVASEADLARDHDREPQWDEIRIGPLMVPRPSNYLDDDDIDEAAFSVAATVPVVATTETAQLVDIIDERHNAAVVEGAAHLVHSGAVAGEALASALLQPREGTFTEQLEAVRSAVRAWADEHVTLDPRRIVEGDHALPVMRIRGEWVYGRHGTPVGLEATVMPELADGDDGAEVRIVWVARVVGFDEGSWIEAEDLVEAKRAVDVALSAEAE